MHPIFGLVKGHQIILRDTMARQIRIQQQVPISFVYLTQKSLKHTVLPLLERSPQLVRLPEWYDHLLQSWSNCAPSYRTTSYFF